MIKKRNLDPSLIQWIMATSGFGPMVGDIRYVAPDVSSTSQFRSQLYDMGVDDVETSIETALGKTTSYRNDVVLVAPGTYAETVYQANMFNKALLGCGPSPDAAIIAPTDGHALLVGVEGTAALTMSNSIIKNMTFKTPSTSSTTWAAFGVAYMTNSVIEDCKFMGTTTTGYDAAATHGLQIGNRTETPWEFSERNRISRCWFGTQGSRLQELGIGIQVGAYGSATPAHRGFSSNIIEDCVFCCYDTGIMLQTGSTTTGGTIIRRNTMTSHQGGVGVNIGIISKSADGADTLAMINDNRITCISDAISNFEAWNTQGNIVAIGSASPVGELPVSS